MKGKVIAKFNMLKIESSLKQRLTNLQIEELVRQVNQEGRQLTVEEIGAMKSRVKEQYIKQCVYKEDEIVSNLLVQKQDTIKALRKSFTETKEQIQGTVNMVDDSINRIGQAAVYNLENRNFTHIPRKIPVKY